MVIGEDYAYNRSLGDAVRIFFFFMLVSFPIRQCINLSIISIFTKALLRIDKSPAVKSRRAIERKRGRTLMKKLVKTTIDARVEEGVAGGRRCATGDTHTHSGNGDKNQPALQKVNEELLSFSLSLSLSAIREENV